MTGYVEGTMHEHQQKKPAHPNNEPHKWKGLDHGARNK